MSTAIKVNNPVTIQIGSKKYDVAIASVRHWQSEDGAAVREYLTIADPGIYEVAGAYVSISPAKPRGVDVVVDTDAGQVVWTPVASGASGAKKDAINAWFKAVLKSE
jgi:hypothetical protein